MNKSILNSYILSCLRDLNDKNSRRSWDVLHDDLFRCGLCKKTKPDKYRSIERVGYCKACMGE